MKVTGFSQRKLTTLKHGGTCDKCYELHEKIVALIDDFDWRNAFAFAREFRREDVARVLYIANGVNDESDWLGMFQLNDGSFAGLSAWCDYTGWD